MRDLSFSIDLKALAILLGLMILAYVIDKAISHRVAPHLFFSQLSTLISNKDSSVRSYLISLPSRLVQGAIILFALAFIDPHFLYHNATDDQPPLGSAEPKEGIGIYFDLDRSGSMNEKVETMGSDGRRVQQSKINILKQVTHEFIANHPDDLIGLVAFARLPEVLAPLTFDKETLFAQLKDITVVKKEADEGTAIGYAIYKTAHLIAATRHFAQELSKGEKPAYDMKGAIIIVVTDGLQYPSPLDQGNRVRTLSLEDAANYAKSQGIKLYIVNVDPRFELNEELAPHRRLMERVTQETGGQFFLVNANRNLADIYRSINMLEKTSLYAVSTTKKVSPPHRFSLYPFLIALGMGLFLCSFILDSTLLRKVP